MANNKKYPRVHWDIILKDAKTNPQLRRLLEKTIKQE